LRTDERRYLRRQATTGQRMDYFQLAFFAVFALIVGRFLYGRLKYGSWTGSFLKGSIHRTIGEVELAQGMGGTQTLKVHLMKSSDGDGDFVGLVIVSKAALAASMQPYKLSKAQARQLASYLNQAVG
jgi:hypothetical protein